MAIGPVRPHVQRFADNVLKKFPINKRNIGGYATSGHIPNSDHYVGLALDFMVYSNKGLGEDISRYALAYGPQYNVKYVIWDRTYYELKDDPNLPWEKEPYTGKSPHTEHVHVSFNRKDPGPNATPYEVPSSTLETGWAAATKYLEEKGITVGLFFAGLVLLIAGLWLAGSELL